MFERHKMNTRCSNKHANTVPTSRGQGVSVHTLAPAQAGAVAAGTAKFRRENLASLTSLDEVKATRRREDGGCEQTAVGRAYGPVAQIAYEELEGTPPPTQPRRQQAPDSGHIPGLGEGLGCCFLIS